MRSFGNVGGFAKPVVARLGVVLEVNASVLAAIGLGK
jgi:hypothetical protein